MGNPITGAVDRESLIFKGNIQRQIPEAREDLRDKIVWANCIYCGTQGDIKHNCRNCGAILK